MSSCRNPRVSVVTCTVPGIPLVALALKRLVIFCAPPRPVSCACSLVQRRGFMFTHDSVGTVTNAQRTMRKIERAFLEMLLSVETVIDRLDDPLAGFRSRAKLRPTTMVECCGTQLVTFFVVLIKILAEAGRAGSGRCGLHEKKDQSMPDADNDSR